MHCKVAGINTSGQLRGRTIAVSADDHEICAAGFACHIAQWPLDRRAPFDLTVILLDREPKTLFSICESLGNVRPQLLCEFSGKWLLPIIRRFLTSGRYSD